MVEDQAFFAETRTDTDALAVPMPHGVEIAIQLRSPEAPERQILDLDLPDGAIVRPAVSPDPVEGDAPGSLEIVQGEQVIGYVHPPLGFDADGQPVATTMGIENQDVVVRADHQGKDLQYPLLLDPEVSVPGNNQNYVWAGWNWGQQLYPGADGVPSGNFGAARNDCAYYCGLYESHPTNTYITNGSYAQWYFRAPANTFIYRTTFGGQAHSPLSIYGRNHTRWFQGIINSSYSAWEGDVNYRNQSGSFGPNPFGPADTATWGIEHDFCFNSPAPRCNPDQRRSSAASEQNFALMALQTQNGFAGKSGVPSGGAKGTYTMAWANVYIGDKRPPVLTGTLPASRDWHDDNTTNITVSASDMGLGVYQTHLTALGATGAGTRQLDCVGSPYYRPCKTQDAATYQLTLPEGSTDLAMRASDVVENTTPTHTWTERIDRTPPNLSEPSGTLYAARDREQDHRFEVADQPRATMRVTATDNGSGIASITATAIDASGIRRALGSTTTGELSLDFDTAILPDGKHTIELVARDRVAETTGAGNRHTTQQTFTVSVDRRGDVVTARELDGRPEDGGESTGLDVHRPGTTLARHEQDSTISTRRVVACPDDPQKLCGEVRRLVRPGAASSNSDSVSVTQGTEERDSRLDPVAAIALLARMDLGEPERTGAIESALEPFQRPPPGHGSTYIYDEKVEESSANVDGEDRRIVRQIYRDQATKLPLRETMKIGEATEFDVYYRYNTDRAELSSLPADYFAVGLSAAGGETETYNLAQGDAAPPPEQGAEDPITLTDALEFRRSHGLQADSDFVGATLANIELERSIAEYGVPLVASEVSELEERDQAADAITTIIDRFGADNATGAYGGAWLDQQTGLVHVGFTRDAADFGAQLRSRFPLAERLRIETVERTASEINSLQATIENDAQTLDASGTEVTAIIPDIPTNSVTVGVARRSAESDQRLRDRYGPAITIREQAAIQTVQGSRCRRQQG